MKHTIKFSELQELANLIPGIVQNLDNLQNERARKISVDAEYKVTLDSPMDVFEIENLTEAERDIIIDAFILVLKTRLSDRNIELDI